MQGLTLEKMQWKSLISFQTQTCQILQNKIQNLAKTLREKDREIARLKTELNSANKENEPVPRILGKQEQKFVKRLDSLETNSKISSTPDRSSGSNRSRSSLIKVPFVSKNRSSKSLTPFPWKMF